MNQLYIINISFQINVGLTEIKDKNVLHFVIRLYPYIKGVFTFRKRTNFSAPFVL